MPALSRRLALGIPSLEEACMYFEELRRALPTGWGYAVFVVAALVFGAAVLEGLVLHRRGRRYDWRAFAVSAADIAGRRVVDALGLSIAAPLALWAYQHRVATVPLQGVLQGLALFLGMELAYYAYHRCAHRVRWFWATHAVHHSPNELTLAASFRLGWTGRLAGNTLFFTPLIWLGFAPSAVFGTLALNLLYQFWLHAAWIPKLGPLEWVLNTPSHHRVHHGSNPEYLDKNFGGVLIVFDRLFGTYAEERADVPVRYGWPRPMTSYNPFVVAFHEWARLLRDLVHARSLRQAARVLFSPP
jgi:sterol desaturase/sphingolipid hydroxylase (fatty acid hydroxylase superfamily)